MKSLALVLVGVALVGAAGCGDDGDEPGGGADAAAGGGGAGGGAGGMAGASGGSGGRGGVAGGGGAGGGGGGAGGGAGGMAGSGGAAGNMAGAGGRGGSGGAGGSGGMAGMGGMAGTGGVAGMGGMAGMGGAGGMAPASASMKVTTTGGTLTGGGATLVIPAGALAAETTITMMASAPADSLPAKTSISGMVYDLGPNGTTFAKPVALTLPLLATPPAGRGPVVSWLDTKTSSWMDLPTTVDGNTVTAQTTHFTLFSVRFIEGVNACRYAACSGSLVGTWDLTDLCIGKAGKDVNDICTKEDTASWVSGTGGSATFTVTADSKYTLAQRLNVRAMYSAACMARVRFASCAAVEMALVQFLKAMNPMCTGTAATGCDCTFVHAVEDKGTVTATNALVRDTEPAGEKQTADACVRNGSVQVRVFTAKASAGSETPVVSGSVYTGKAK